MPNRMLRDWTGSERISNLSVHAERFFVRLIMKVDDFGCFYADTRLLKANLFPLLLDQIREADLLRWMAECQIAGLIVLYETDSKKYVQILDFKQRLDRKSSKFPQCPESVLVGIRVANDNQPPPEVEVEVEEKRIRFAAPTLEEVVSYFSEKGYTKESAEKAFTYYNEAKWKDARGNQVKNWKQKMISVWFKDENKLKTNGTSNLSKAIQAIRDSE